MTCKRSNLSKLGIVDFVAIGYFTMKGGNFRHSVTDYSYTMFVTDLCNKNPDGLRNGRVKGKQNYREEHDTLQIHELVNYEKGGKIGYIFADGVFFYEGALTLKEALGWFIATKIGDKDIPDDFDLDGYCSQMLEQIRNHGTTFHTYLFLFMETLYRALQETIGNEERKPTWFLLGANCIWNAATKELGIDHPGYRVETPLAEWNVPSKW